MNGMKAVFGFLAIVLGSATLATGVQYATRESAVAADVVVSTRTVGVFDRVHLSGPFTTTIAASAPERLTIAASPDTIARVTASVRDGTLEIGMRGSSGAHEPIRIGIAVPHLRGMTNDGAGSVTISGIANDIAIANDGAGSIVASGRAGNETVSLAGVGKIDTTGVDARDVTATDDGVGSVHVRGSGTLTPTVDGIGEIRYAGSPQHVERNVNGIGRIAPL